MEITLKEVHVGACKTVAALSLGKKSVVSNFFHDLKESNPAAFRQIFNALRVISSEDHYRNETKFKRVGNEIYEVRLRNGTRLYTFLCDNPDLPKPQLIIATNGGKKNTRKEQSGDIHKAEQLREKFLEAMAASDTILNYISLPE